MGVIRQKKHAIFPCVLDKINLKLGIFCIVRSGFLEEYSPMLIAGDRKPGDVFTGQVIICLTLSLSGNLLSAISTEIEIQNLGL